MVVGGEVWWVRERVGKGYVERRGEGGEREGMSIKGHRMCEGLGAARAAREDYRSVRESRGGSDERSENFLGRRETLSMGERRKAKS